MSDILKTIHSRMLENDEFTFLSLHARLPDEAYRLADRTLQSFRRRGFATFRRDGRTPVWSLTPSGIEFIESGANAAANSPALEVSEASPTRKTTTTEGKSNV